MTEEDMPPKFRIAFGLGKFADNLTGFKFSAILIIIGKNQNVKAIHLGIEPTEFDLNEKEELTKNECGWIFYHPYDGYAAQWCEWENVAKETMSRIVGKEILSISYNFKENDRFPL